MIIESAGSAPTIPDDLTIPQFIFDYNDPSRPQRDPSTPWFIEDGTGRSIAEGELRWRTGNLAAGLQAQFRIGDDDVVLLFSRNHVDYPVVVWAVNYLGGIVACSNPDFPANEVLYQIQLSKATVIFAGADVLDVALEAASLAKIPAGRVVSIEAIDNGNPDQLCLQDILDVGALTTAEFPERKLKPGEAKTKTALYMFSSGTTGPPKAVAIAHYNVISTILQYTAHNQMGGNSVERRCRPGDVALAVLPMFHIYGMVLPTHSMLYAGMTVVVVSKFHFEQMLQSIVRHRITHLFLVPPQIVLLCKHTATRKYDLQKYIRMILFGSAPLSQETHSRLLELFPNAQIGQGYSLTEAGAVFTCWPASEKHGQPGSAGVLVPGCKAKIVKPDGSLAGYDEPGELWLKTPAMALGYANNPEATKATFVDGWVRSGDEVKVDKNNRVWILDRIKELIKVKGLQVAPAELEGCILDLPEISATCVVGVPDDYSGEVPMAFVALSEDILKKVKSPAEAAAIKEKVIKHVAANKAAFKHLAGGVEIIPQIPTSPSGKILRRLLRDQARQKHIKSKL